MTLALSLTLLAAAQATASPSPAPDYRQDATWLCRPGRADACAANQDVTVIRADGKRKIEKFRAATAPTFDCFYVYPTVSLDPSANSDMAVGPEEQMVAAAQAGRFASKCRVFAPLYRQVTLTALLSNLTGKPMAADRAMALADVTAAWNDYLARDNKGRGVVLIGHSQGAAVLKAMLMQGIDGDAAARRNIVSAMLIGTAVAVPAGGDVGGDFRTMKLCRAADQYGCIVSYASFRADAPPPADSRFGKADRPGMVAACTNPAALGATPQSNTLRGTLGGGKAVTDAILGAKGAGLSSAAMGDWTADRAPVTTGFVKVPGLISAECVSRGGFDYLAVTVNADPRDPRTDTIVGDVQVDGKVQAGWGLHLIDMPVEMGNLVDLAQRQADAWRGLGPRRR